MFDMRVLLGQRDATKMLRISWLTMSSLTPLDILVMGIIRRALSLERLLLDKPACLTPLHILAIDIIRRAF